MPKTVNIALVGNPNSGKSSLFNALTGLKQQVGNFPGVTVDKKTGTAVLAENITANFIDLPGTYSLYPKRADEWVAYKVLMQQDVSVKPELIVLVADASSLKRNLLFCSQILDLKVPVVVALSMTDIARKNGTKISIVELQRELGVQVVSVNPRKNKGIPELKKAILAELDQKHFPVSRDFIDNHALAPDAIDAVRGLQSINSNYAAIHHLINHEQFDLNAAEHHGIETIAKKHAFNATKTQAEEIMQRYARIKHIMQAAVIESDPLQKSLLTEKLDNILLHRRWGYLILLGVLFLLFQSVFLIAQYPMDGIEWLFNRAGRWLVNTLPPGWFGDLLVNGLVEGLKNVVVFVPQIMILFGLVTLLEDTGYMARISFLTDKLMRKVGLNGKSVMPMISGFACAVPAIMSARNIENRKERLLTILITPLMSCSARLPVYIILTGIVIPDTKIFGVISLPGLVMMALYMLGTIIALVTAWVLKWFIKSVERSYFILELPVYRSPRWKNIMVTMVEKAKIFVFDAGKVIMVISLLLWALSSYGPPEKMKSIHNDYTVRIDTAKTKTTIDQLEKERDNALLQQSYVGILGKSIEPAIAPLGYDWKIGIALITSFAAREVFVGTMGVLYSVGKDADENSVPLRQKMREAVKSDGTKVYTLASGLSLMVFYVLALQCMSTIAVVKRETRGWKWPVVQLLYMTALAYVLSWVVYKLFS